MAFHNKPLVSTVAWILFVSLAISCASSSRVLLDDDDGLGPAVVGPASQTTTPGAQVGTGAIVGTGTAAGPVVGPGAETAPVVGPGVGTGPVVGPGTAAGPIVGSGAGTGPVVGPGTAAGSVVGSGAGTGSVVGPGAGAGPAVVPEHGLVFYMHDIVGGTNPSAMAITGIVQNPAVSGSVPFAKPNGAVLPVNNGVPQNNNNGGIVSNNNVPFFTGLAGNTANLLQNSNNGNGGGNNLISGGSGFPFINGAQLPPGMTLQKLMFGTITAFDDELTESHEIGSGLVGKAEGFYVASSVDGTSQTMAFTAMFKGSGSGYDDTLTFMGVHMTAAAESHLAVMGGTGKFLNAKGFATVKTFPPSLDQHNTDGIETILEFTVYLV